MHKFTHKVNERGSSLLSIVRAVLTVHKALGKLAGDNKESGCCCERKGLTSIFIFGLGPNATKQVSKQENANKGVCAGVSNVTAAHFHISPLKQL